MELRDFAEQVLFATTLEEKLRSPETITDELPGPPAAAPAAPGRPAELRFKPAEAGKSGFPGLSRLDRPAERGRLLHFFANHELLATELMALVLLRFPEAPAAFRRGVLQTLRDEQAHTRLYLRRMAECGVAFGELPVSGYFWRAVSPMASPLDYVAGLSLTFEQANLDFCRQFARGFAAAGDAETARLLDGIYRHEIGHVAYGLKWFRRWKEPGRTDWDAFCRQLKFPLSPQRAKGITLNVAGRRAAGFDDGFIAELDVHAQSKGRTPAVWLFNPFTEGRLARGAAFTPVKQQAQLARDLAGLPQFLARQDDIVLVPRRPSVAFLSRLKQAGLPLPEFVELGDSAPWPPARLPPAASERLQRKLGALRPWARGPDSAALLEPLRASVTGEAGPVFHELTGQLYSKAWSAAFLRRFLANWPADAAPAADAFTALCSAAETGVAAGSPPDALAVIADFRRRGHHRLVVKESLGLAGHNAIRLWEPELTAAQLRWLERATAAGRTVVIEPWLERLVDFSVQFELEPAGLRLCGYTGLHADLRGQYLGNWAEPACRRQPPAAVAAAWSGLPDAARRLHRLYLALGTQLEPGLRRAGHRGPVGVDAFIYRDARGEPRLKPVVEINPRHTMGRLTLELMRHVCPGAAGHFRLVSRRQARAEGFADFAAYDRALRKRLPWQLEGEPVVRLREGALCLNDPAQAEACLAVFQVSAGRPASPANSAPP